MQHYIKPHSKCFGIFHKGGKVGHIAVIQTLQPRDIRFGSADFPGDLVLRKSFGNACRNQLFFNGKKRFKCFILFAYLFILQCLFFETGKSRSFSRRLHDLSPSFVSERYPDLSLMFSDPFLQKSAK